MFQLSGLVVLSEKVFNFVNWAGLVCAIPSPKALIILSSYFMYIDGSLSGSFE